jgi:glucokinase
LAATQNGYVIGVDIGGTKVAAGLVRPGGKIQYQNRTPMISSDGAESGLASVKSAIDAVFGEFGGIHQAPGLIGGIGICCPGPLDPSAGIVINPPNLPCWRNFPLAAEISRLYGLPVKLDNDANAAALAETLWGAGSGYQNVFYATIGTGIGTGIVLNGRIHHGRTGAGAEGGHMSIDYRGPRCGCGKRGCIEALASGPAIAVRARAKFIAKQNGHSTLPDLAGGDINAITSEMVGRAHAAGDRVATEVLAETVELLTLWLGNIVDLLEPDVVILGGGVASMLQPFFEEIHKRLPDCCINSRCQEIPLLAAAYGEEAGVAGGAALTSEGILCP